MRRLFTIIGDPHLTHKSIDRVRKLTELVESKGNPAIWLGDMLDTKEIIRGKCQNFWIEYFSNSKLDHYVLVGNHDYFNLECEDHSLKFLENISNVTLVDRPMDFVNTPFYMIPYIHDQKELKAAIKAGPKDSVLIGHLELKGFDYGNGHICEAGLTPRSFKQFKRVISGHFHKYQEKDNFVYLGSPFSHTFGESNQDKWIMTYDADTDEFELELTNPPMHFTKTVNCDELFEHSGEEMQHWLEFMDDLEEKKHYWRYILTGKQENIDRFPVDRYKDSGLNIKFLTRPSDSVLNDVNIKDTSSNEEQFTQWANLKGMKKETIDLGLKIMEASRAK